MKRHSCCDGYTLVELLTVVAIIGIMALVVVPAFTNITRMRNVRAAAAEMRSIFREVRSRAIATGKNTAVRFIEDDGGWRYAIYHDGDDDGVRNDDIRRGIDPMVVAPRDVFPESASIRIGLPRRPLPDPDGPGLLRPGSSPVRFNRSRLCSFSLLGGGTSGSIFITDGESVVGLVRVYGPTGRVRLLLYDEVSGRWEAR